MTAIYRPRLFIVEAGNSFGLFGDFAARLGLTVHRVKLAPGAGDWSACAPFADATAGGHAQPGADLDADDLDEDRDRRRRCRMRTSNATCWVNWRSPRG